MPCNTAHLWYEAVAQQLSVPMLHIVDAVVEDLLAITQGAQEGSALRVGLLGTEATATGRLYPLRAMHDHRARAWQWLLPPPDGQARLHDGIAAVKRGDLQAGRAAMLQAFDTLQRLDVDAVVYACTEVPLALAQGFDAPVPVSDSTAALARYTVRRASSNVAAASLAQSTK
jgi:aspartate racemase